MGTATVPTERAQTNASLRDLAELKLYITDNLLNELAATLAEATRGGPPSPWEGALHRRKIAGWCTAQLSKTLGAGPLRPQQAPANGPLEAAPKLATQVLGVDHGSPLLILQRGGPVGWQRVVLRNVGRLRMVK